MVIFIICKWIINIDTIETINYNEVELLFNYEVYSVAERELFIWGGLKIKILNTTNNFYLTAYNS